MENKRSVKQFFLILGGALLGAFLILVMPVFAYDKENTHPALTDEIVDFYNLSFPNNKLTEEEKQWFIRGSIDEDTGERPLFHFYDPVYNRGVGMVHLSSKEWATKEGAQAAYYNSQLTGFAAISGGDSANDFSYQRALDDYAKGDRKRAFVAFGHTLHLLEDAGVPDHTRNDAHPSFIHGQESPYEAEMAKWSPQNFNIARSLSLRREKPVSLNSVESYFDKIANYSNNNFFSKDTIFSDQYFNPKIENWSRILSNKEEVFLGYKTDEIGKKYILVLARKKSGESFKYYLNNTYILDGYWDRLSKEVVINGAGALRLFLEEAEKAKQEYLAKAGQKKPNFWAQLLGVFGFVDNNEELTTSDVRGTSEVDDDELTISEVGDEELVISDVRGTSEVNRLPVVTNDGDNGDTSGDRKVSPSLSPVLSPKPSVSPLVSPMPEPELTTPDGRGTSGVKTGRVIINEIAWAGTEASAADEWIELYNAENYDINLSGWTFKADDGTPEITIEDGKIIKAQSYFLLERTDDTTVNSIPVDQIYTGALGNDGEFLKLSDSSGITVDTAGNSSGAWPVGSSIGKISMERTDSGGWKNFTGSPSAKDANGNFINGTPKAPNSPGMIMVAGGGGGGGSSSSPTPTPSPSVSPTPSPEPDGDTASSGDVIINEIAWMGTVSSANDEWIELYNTTNQTINLTGWTLKAQDGIPAITLSGDVGALGFFLLERTDDETLPIITADQIYTGALGNTGEFLVLKDVSGAIINQTDGSNGWKINGNNEVIGDNTTKETAQKFGNVWKTATSTPRAENKENTALNTPSAVTNLAAAHNSPIITASWSAPDQGSYSPASLSYDLRYSAIIFTEAASASWWSDATQIASSSLPSVGEKGASQSASFDVTYEYGQTLYFALKTKVINITTFNVVSPQSNVATVSFPSAVDANAWAMWGKDQYHTSFANVSGPGPGAAVSWEFNAGPDEDPNQPDNVFRSDQISSPCGNGGDYIRLYDYNHNSQGAFPCSGGAGTWGGYFNASFNDTVFTEFEQVGTLPCGTFEQCSSSALSIKNVVLRADGWTPPPTGSLNNAMVSADGDIYFGASDGSSHKLIKLDKNGLKQWEYSTNVSIGMPAVLSDETVYFGRIGAGGVLAFTALNSNGSKKWDYDNASTVSSITVSSGGEPHFTYSSGTDKLAVLNTDGSAKAPFPISASGLAGFAPVVLDDGTIITSGKVSGNQQFTAYSVDGTQLWQIFYTGTNGSTPADPSHDKSTGKTYSAAGPKLFSIPSDGSILNSTDIAPWNYSAATMVAIDSGTLYVGFNSPSTASGSLLYALNKTDLSTKWSFQADDYMNKQLVIDNTGNAHFSTQNGNLYSVDSAGNQRWVIETGSNSDISPVLTENGLIWGYGSRVVVIK